MRQNRTMKILAAGGVAVGIAHSQLANAEIPKMYGAADLDWVFLDSEHSPFSSDTLHELIRAYRLTDVTAVVRVCDFQYDLVARALDSGAEGIIFPRCEDPAQLAHAVRGAKFPPHGHRGFGLGPPQIGYQSATFDEIMAHCNRETLLIAQIESTRALDRLHELASVDGLHSLLIGPADLSISLGVGGQWDHPRLIAAADRVIAACGEHGLWPAIQVRDGRLADFWIGRGMKLIGCSTEAALLWNAVQGLTVELRSSAGRA
jgi:2-keto-3-deoxy-L-rhamnonate aldolase RhmA